MTRHTLTYGSIVKVLEYSPEGWDETNISIARNDRYMGLFRTFSSNMRFVEDGAELLRIAFYTEGTNATVYLKIETYNKLSMAWDVILAAGEIDFTSVSDTRDAFEVPVIDGGLSAKIKANENVKYNFEIAPTTTLRYSGIRLYAGSASWNKASFQTPLCAYQYRNHSAPTLNTTNNDTTQGGYTVYDVAESSLSPVSFPNTPFLKANRNASIDVTINWAAFNMLTYLYYEDYDLSTPANNTWYGRLNLLVYDATGVLKSTTQIKQISIIPTNQIGDYYTNSVGSSVSYSGTFDLLAGETMRLNWIWTPTIAAQMNDTNKVQFTVTSGNITVAVQTVLPTIEIPARTAKDLFTDFINKMSFGSPVQSSFLDLLDADSMPLFVSGDCIRGIYPYNLQLSFVDFFEAMRNVYDLGFGVMEIGGVETAVLEIREYFFNNLSAFNIGDVSEMTVTTATDKLLKSLKAGYKTQEYKELNGRDEFNSEQIWVFPFSRLNTEQTWQSPVRADMYGIDNLRISYNGNTDTDTKSDNDVFIVDAEFVETLLGIDYYQCSRDKVTYITGVEDPVTAYNVALSPKHCLLRRASELASICWGLTGSIELASADKNTDLVATIGGVQVIENADIVPSTLGNPNFYPLIIDFTCAQSTTAWDLLLDVGNNALAFNYNGVTLYGFILEAGVNIEHRAVINVKLLCSALTDITNLY